MDTPATTSRRELIRRGTMGAAAAGAAWVAPAVMSYDTAGAAGSCTTDVLPWSSRGNCFDPNTEVTAAPINGVRVFELATSQATTTTVPSVSANWTNTSPDNFRIRSQDGGACDIGCATAEVPRGGQSSFYSLSMRETNSACGGAGTIGRWVQATFEFRASNGTSPVFVSALRFTLLDIDSQSGNYWDRVELYINGQSDLARAGSAATLASVGAVGSGADLAIDTATQPTGSCISQPNAAQAGWQATSNNCSAGANDLTGNVSVRFLRGVNRITIRFRDIRNNGATPPTNLAPQTVQWVGISNMTWCGTQPAA